MNFGAAANDELADAERNAGAEPGTGGRTDTAGASLKQSTAATGQRSPAALALALAFPAALEKYAKNHFHKHLGIKRTLKKPRTQHHPLPPAPLFPLPSKQAAYQKHLSSLSSCFVVVPRRGR